MKRFGIFRAAVAALALSLVVAISPAHAQWLRAESERFVAYGNGSEADLREYVEQLEKFESLLRALHGMNMREAPPRPFHLYLTRDGREMRRIYPTARETTGGSMPPVRTSSLASSTRPDNGTFDPPTTLTATM